METFVLTCKHCSYFVDQSRFLDYLPVTFTANVFRGPFHGRLTCSVYIGHEISNGAHSLIWHNVRQSSSDGCPAMGATFCWRPMWIGLSVLSLHGSIDTDYNNILCCFWSFSPLLPFSHTACWAVFNNPDVNTRLSLAADIPQSLYILGIKKNNFCHRRVPI